MASHVINLNSYGRKAHFDYFRSLQYPYVGVTVDQDVTTALHFSKETGKSFYLTILHAVALAADTVPELRQRIRNNQIIEYLNAPLPIQNARKAVYTVTVHFIIICHCPNTSDLQRMHDETAYQTA